MTTTFDPDQVPGFSLAERDRRWQAAQRMIAEQDLSALVVYGDRESAFPGSYAPDTWLTNDRPGSIVIVPRDADPISVVFLPTVVEDHVQARRCGRPGWIRPADMYVGKMGSNVAQVLEERGITGGRIGVVGLNFQPPYYFDGPMPYHTYQSLLEELPGVEWVDVGRAFFGLQAVKSAEELAVLRWSADVGEAMCEAMRATARPGVRENVVYAAALHTAASRLGFTTQILMGSGSEFVGWGPPPWTYRPEVPRVLEEGDVLLSEVFTSFGMLETQHQPAIAIGEVHPDVHRAAEAASASYDLGVAALKAGNTFGDVVEQMKIPMREIEGAWHVHPLVHSINPFGLIGVGDRMASLPEVDDYAQVISIPTVGTDEVLRAGMTFAVEPNCAIGSRVANVGGTVVVGEDGGVALNHLATRLMTASG